MVPSQSPDTLPEPVTCPVCADALGDAPPRCGRCDTGHHRECWDYVGGCAVFACKDAAPETAVAPARARALQVLTRSLVHQFVWSFRASWWAFLSLSLGMLFLLLGMAFGQAGIALGILGMPFMFFGAVTYVVLLPLTLFLQGMVEWRLGRKLDKPKGGWRPLLDRLDLPTTDARTLTVVRHLPRGTLGVLALGGLYSALQIGPSVVIVLGFVTPFAYGLARGIASATEGRLVFLSTMQNRLLAASKEG